MRSTCPHWHSKMHAISSQRSPNMGDSCSPRGLPGLPKPCTGAPETLRRLPPPPQLLLDNIPTTGLQGWPVQPVHSTPKRKRKARPEPRSHRGQTQLQNLWQRSCYCPGSKGVQVKLEGAMLPPCSASVCRSRKGHGAGSGVPSEGWRIPKGVRET